MQVSLGARDDRRRRVALGMSAGAPDGDQRRQAPEQAVGPARPGGAIAARVTASATLGKRAASVS